MGTLSKEKGCSVVDRSGGVGEVRSRKSGFGGWDGWGESSKEDEGG